MAARPKLSRADLQAPFEGEQGVLYPPILSPAKLAELLGMSRKTVYHWQASGFLDGTFRKRGKHTLYFRDRVLAKIFDGNDWKTK